MQIKRFDDLIFAQRPERALKLDIRVPKSDARPPLVVYIPVGGMRVCDRSYAQWWLVDHGFAMASIECRVSSEAVAPAQIHDCKAAVRWLRRSADRFGYRPDAIGAWGHSAGGLLAALLGTSAGVSQLEGPPGEAEDGCSSAIQAVCDECGSPHDLSYFARPEIKSRFPGVDGNIAAYLGGPVEQRRDLARLVSPFTYISPSAPPFLLIQGDADDVVPPEETIAFHETLVAANVESTLLVLKGTGHGWDASLTNAAIPEFFNRTLSSRPGPGVFLTLDPPYK